MASAPIRYLAILLVLAQGFLALGAGRTLCLPLLDCSHHEIAGDASAPEDAHASACGHHGCHHHDVAAHTHGVDAPWSVAPAHSAEDAVRPASFAAADPDCGCHLHLPVPDRDECPRLSGAGEIVAPSRSPLPAALSEPPAPRGRSALTSRTNDAAWLVSDEICARAMSSLRV